MAISSGCIKKEVKYIVLFYRLPDQNLRKIEWIVVFCTIVLSCSLSWVISLAALAHLNILAKQPLSPVTLLHAKYYTIR